MKLSNVKEVESLIKTADECSGSVWLESNEGDRINLKSKFSQYVAIGVLISAEADNLELFCALPEDERKFYKFFNEYPEVLS